MLVRVEAPHFVAGLLLDGERCVLAAPILAWAVGLERDDLRAEFRVRGWRASVIKGTRYHPLLAVYGGEGNAKPGRVTHHGTKV